MGFLQALTKIRLTLLRPRRPMVPYMVLRGKITPQMTYLVHQLLRKVPKQTKKLAVVISSSGGDVSQAVIIAEALKKKAKMGNFELLTFAQEFALNSAFYLLCQGDRVYADRTTYLGGIEVGESKVNLGTFSQYFNTIVYSSDPSFAAQRRTNQPYQQPISSDMKEVYSLFSQQMKQRILASRKNAIKNPQSVDLSKFYSGEEALKLGMIDEIGRVHQTVANLVPDAYSQQLKENKLDQLVRDLKKIQIKK